MPPAAVAGPLAALSTAAQVVGAVSTIGSGLKALKGEKKPSVAPTAQAEPFKPQRPTELAAPSSLGAFAGDPTQQRTAIATKGVNTGLGKEEDAYYKNLIQRSLIGDSNQITGSMSSLAPVESQYFGRQGINTSDINEFLRQIQGSLK